MSSTFINNILQAHYGNNIMMPYTYKQHVQATNALYNEYLRVQDFKDVLIVDNEEYYLVEVALFCLKNTN